MRSFVLCFGLSLAACFSPVPPAGAPCGAEGACPSGLVCTGGFCQSTVIDADVLVDAELDASPDADFDAPPLDAAPDAPPIDAAPVMAMWSAGTPFPTPRSFVCAVVFEGRIYAIGGSYQGNAISDVVSSDVAANGTLGAWKARTGLPVATRWHSCAVHPATRSLYVTGGDDGTTARANVWHALVAADGSVGTWVAEPALPNGRRGAETEIIGDTMYVIGGEQGDGFQLKDTVYVSTIGLAGSLSSWTTTTALPMADYEFGTAVSGTHVLMVGGYNGDAAVRTATATAGALSAFTATTALPSSQERQAVAALNGWVYSIAGYNQYPGGSRITLARRAPITPTGTVGAWQDLPPLPTALAYIEGVATAGHVYTLGGSNDVISQDNVYILTPPSP